MLKLIARNEKYLSGYKDYCQEFYDHKISTFRPMPPDKVTLKWFRETYRWYQDREKGLIQSQPKSICLWAIDEDEFIGEFQLRPELNDDIMTSIGSIGYSVSVSQQGRGYGKLILTSGLEVARELALEKVILLIDESNIVSRHLCESLGGKYYDTIITNDEEGSHSTCRYWIYL